MLTLDQPADAVTAKQYILSHDARVVKLSRMTARTLRGIYSKVGYLDVGLDLTIDEMISGIVGAEYPDITTARKVYVDAVTSPAGRNA